MINIPFFPLIFPTTYDRPSLLSPIDLHLHHDCNLLCCFLPFVEVCFRILIVSCLSSVFFCFLLLLFFFFFLFSGSACNLCVQQVWQSLQHQFFQQIGTNAHVEVGSIACRPLQKTNDDTLSVAKIEIVLINCGWSAQTLVCHCFSFIARLSLFFRYSFVYRNSCRFSSRYFLGILWLWSFSMFG